MPDEIPNQAFTKRTRILKGWSDDAKYRVTTDDGRNLLLRVSAREKYDRKKRGVRSSQNDRIPGHSGTGRYETLGSAVWKKNSTGKTRGILPAASVSSMTI